MTPGNLLQQLNHVITGGNGFWVDRMVHNGDWRDDANGEPVDEGSAPTLLRAGISWDDAESGYLWLAIPDDYDDDSDALKLILQGSCATAAAGDTLDVASGLRWRDGDVAAGVSVTIAVDALVFNKTTIQTLTTDLSGLGLKAGDNVRFTLTAANSGASEVVINGARFRYRSTLVLQNQVDR